jgi:hypothetical protein
LRVPVSMTIGLLMEIAIGIGGFYFIVVHATGLLSLFLPIVLGVLPSSSASTWADRPRRALPRHHAPLPHPLATGKHYRVSGNGRGRRSSAADAAYVYRLMTSS